MMSPWLAKGKRVHCRNIEVSTFECDDQRIVVEGFLREERFQNSYLITGDVKPPGVFHHMIVRLLVNHHTLVIEDVAVEMPTVPRDECLETVTSLEQIKGLSITKGFTAKVKQIAGGNKGCSHLVELLLAMAPAAIQGFASFRSRKPQGFDRSQAGLVIAFLVDTCRPWRKGGPLAEKHQELLSK
ncbi:MAG: DUF2889 domain-containing protein [Smithellaceae bacterium]|nr:DUF2889 domain-containing protein [Smithellaceae bacterium]